MSSISFGFPCAHFCLVLSCKHVLTHLAWPALYFQKLCLPNGGKGFVCACYSESSGGWAGGWQEACASLSMPGHQTLERQALMGLSSCSDLSTGPSENFWLSNAWDILTVSRPQAETCFISGGEAAVEVLGAGGALPLQVLSPHLHWETTGFCALCPACLEPAIGASPGQVSREDAPRDRVTVWALGFPKLSLEEAVQVSCSRGQRKALASLGGRVV